MAGTNETLGGGGIHHIALRSADFDASVRFYTGTLGFREVLAWGEGDGRAIMLDTGDGSCLEVFAGGDAEKPEGRLLHFALNAADVDGVVERARQAGAEVTVEPKDVDILSEPGPTPVRIAFFTGPDGETVELFRRRDG